MGNLSSRLKNLRDFQKVESPKGISVEKTGQEISVPTTKESISVNPDRVAQLNKEIETLNFLAYHDELTGLPNRRKFKEEIEVNIGFAKRFGMKVAVVLLDMDRFKHINDTQGHDAGDALLKEVARRMNQVLQPPNIAARLGGDEFTALLPGVSGRKEAEQIARQLLSSLQPPFNVIVNGSAVVLESTPSIGVSIYPEDAESVDRLLKTADLAMYDVKQNGKNNVMFYKEK